MGLHADAQHMAQLTGLDVRLCKKLLRQYAAELRNKSMEEKLDRLDELGAFDEFKPGGVVEASGPSDVLLEGGEAVVPVGGEGGGPDDDPETPTDPEGEGEDPGAEEPAADPEAPVEPDDPAEPEEPSDPEPEALADPESEEPSEPEAPAEPEEEDSAGSDEEPADDPEKEE